VPNYWDFLYFSFTISVAVQTDVTVRSRSCASGAGPVGAVLLLQPGVLGLSINIAASLLNG
jgi:uncharacterized membrane protein